MNTAELRDGLSDLHKTAQMALDCAAPAFKAYLRDVHGMTEPLTDDNAVAWVFRWLHIHSFTEIRTNPAAREVWARLRQDFDEWRVR